MKIPVVKELVEKYSLTELEAAEAAIAEGETPAVEVPGDDEGEQLTHAFAALFIRRMMEEQQVDFKTALREYTKMVRETLN